MAARKSIALLCLMSAAAAGADTAYVTDILQLGLHKAPDTSDRAFENLQSGARLEILERSTHYARVRTDAGIEGWVKAAYIVTETPARHRLEALETEVAALRAALEDARTTEQRAIEETERLRTREAGQAASEKSLREAVARLEQENADYAGRVADYRMSMPMSWVLAALVLSFLGGGAAGGWALDLFIRRRHAGYRIY